MIPFSKSVRITLLITKGLILVISLLALGIFPLIEWSSSIHPLSSEKKLAIGIGYLCSVPWMIYGLCQLLSLLGNILKAEVFTYGNVTKIQRIRNCCIGTSLVSVIACLFFLPLIIPAAIMGFLSFVVHAAGQVMYQAVAIREENDLTV